MYEPTLLRVLECVSREDRAAAVRVLRTAIEEAELPSRDGVELILTLRRGSPTEVLEAIAVVRTAPPGSYRYVPAPANARD